MEAPLRTVVAGPRREVLVHVIDHSVGITHYFKAAPGAVVLRLKEQGHRQRERRGEGKLSKHVDLVTGPAAPHPQLLALRFEFHRVVRGAQQQSVAAAAQQPGQALL